MQEQKGIPPGWEYNPSTWGQRIPLVVIAMVGFFIALYLASYQVGMLKDVWDPFFGNGSKKILDSSLSRVLPIPDALLGAFGYLADAVTGIIGGKRRWKTMPWMVVVFGIAIGPLGLVSIFLVIAQPVMIGAWCTLCLFSAFISVIMISPALDEMLASLQYLQRVKKMGYSRWKAFVGNSEIAEKVQ